MYIYIISISIYISIYLFIRGSEFSGNPAQASSVFKKTGGSENHGEPLKSPTCPNLCPDLPIYLNYGLDQAVLANILLAEEVFLMWAWPSLNFMYIRVYVLYRTFTSKPKLKTPLSSSFNPKT